VHDSFFGVTGFDSSVNQAGRGNAVSSNSKGFFRLEESFSQLTDRIAFAVHIQLWGKSPETQSISLTIIWKATGSKHDGTGSRI
jgi:hypothetical protein